ncbi:hypothetical protein ONV78_26385 [Hahella sp. CR1]|uniref:hypothetical protein n=1 Tax=Hahella sp. CR1 TaxID=2992807 RepID=UPI0024421D6C|nr:hypothetical protein [Hahella sp. CR1]MDG9671289.1 hypothetical protein [Hahella sp. CR1]
MKPEQVLAENENMFAHQGVTLRKGSIAAFMLSARDMKDERLSDAERTAAKNDLLGLIPGLRQLGVFDTFEIRDPEIRALVEQAGR